MSKLSVVSSAPSTKSKLFGLGGLLAVTALSLAAAACTVDPGESVGDDGAAAKLPGDKTDCFASCKQADFDKLTNVGDKGKFDLGTACKNLMGEWSKPVANPAWPGWDPKKPICIGHRKSIEGRKDCNRLVDAPGWTECKNELMLACARDKQPGWGPIILVPPTGGFPPPRNPPSITDQELACIDKWKCPTQADVQKKSAGLRAKAYAPVVCDDSWVSEEVPTSDPPAATPVVDAVPVESDYRFAQ